MSDKVPQFKALAPQTTTNVKMDGVLVVNKTPFNSVFEPKPLDAIEAQRIEKLLVDSYQPGKIEETQVPTDTEQLKQITVEIKAIGKQGLVLTGERVHRARDLLKPYRDGTFTQWLEDTFGSKKTGFNMLAYYEFYLELSHDELREQLKKIPQRAAYILASRNGDIEVKAKIVNEHHSLRHEDLVKRIKELLPTASDDGRAKKNSKNKLISNLRAAVLALQKQGAILSGDERKEISDLRILLEELTKV